MAEPPAYYGRSLSGGLLWLAEDVEAHPERYTPGVLARILTYFAGRAAAAEGELVRKAPRRPDAAAMDQHRMSVSGAETDSSGWGGTL